MELDHLTWVDETVREEAERFVAIKLDFTHSIARLLYLIVPEAISR